jgi:hypothetical protein
MDTENTTALPDLTAVKAAVRAFHTAMARATPQSAEATLAAHLAPDCDWRGVHPFNTQRGPEAIARTFWIPFLQAFSRVQRREDIFFAGLNEIDGFEGTWACSMGHLMGLFDAPFLGIPPTGKIAMLHYAEFHRVAQGKIVQSALFVDLLHLMLQAGLDPLPAPQTAAHLVQPGPRTHDGVLIQPQAADEGRKTLALINAMIGAINLANADGLRISPQDELAQHWHDDMLWWGPAGIGATYTIPRYIEQHQGPFRRGITHRQYNGHICRMAEGAYGGFFGWPNLTLINGGGFMGLPATDMPADMRVVDIYRRAGDKLAENWVFIDMLHFLKMQGVDVLGKLAAPR